MEKLLAHSNDDQASRNASLLRDVVRRYGWLYRIRPQSLAEPLYRLVGPQGGRAIVEVSGARLYIDPFTTSGWGMVEGHEYEPDLVRRIRASCPPGGVFFDVGANQGNFSAIAATAVGERGLVVAVEPQSRLRDILEINLALNSKGAYRIFRNAIGDRDGDIVRLNLGPTSHSGASSLVRAYRWSKKTEDVTTRSIDSIVAELGDIKIDMMKVDVEGFEPEVVRSAAKTLAAKRIGVLAVDFHGSILASRGVDPRQTDAQICGYGYRRTEGNADSGYALYSAL